MSFINNDWKIETLDKVNDFDISMTFPEVIDGQIDTRNFLNASQDILKLVDKFGKVFAPIKYDIQNNIDKMTTKYLLNMQKHTTIQDLILSEKQSGKKMTAAYALLWLIRGLKMVQLFIEKIVENSKPGQLTEDLGASVIECYKKALEPYHSWMATQLFSLLSRMIPTRSQILLDLTDIEPKNEGLQFTIQAMERFANGLKTNLTTLQCFMHDNNLDNI